LSHVINVGIDGELYFPANDGTHGFQLWRTTGGGTGAEMLTNFSSTASFTSLITGMIVFKSRVYFTAKVSDTAPVMTYSVGVSGDVRQEPMSGGILCAFALALDDHLVYVDPAGGLYSTDGDGQTTTYLAPSTFSSAWFTSRVPYSLKVGGKGFIRFNDSVHGTELWQTDGTPAGTILAADINPTAGSGPDTMYLFKNDLYFYAASDSTHRDLWRYDFTAPTAKSMDFHFDSPSPQINVTFDDNMSSGLSASNLSIIDLATDAPVANILQGFDAASRAATFTFADTIPADGNYRATISGAIDAGANSMVDSKSVDFYFLNADANRDRLVDTQDFNRLAANFGGASKVFSQGDFDYDQAVDSDDFNLLVSQHGKRLPEPAGMASVAATLTRATPSQPSPAVFVRDEDEAASLASVLETEAPR